MPSKASLSGSTPSWGEQRMGDESVAADKQHEAEAARIVVDHPGAVREREHNMVVEAARRARVMEQPRGRRFAG